MPITSVDDIVTRVIGVISGQTKKARPEPGSVIHDAFVLPVSTALSWDSTMLTLTQSMQSLTTLLSLSTDTAFKTSVAEALAVSVSDVDNIISAAIERIGRNYGITRKVASAAYGTVYFYTSTAPSVDQVISSLVVSTTTGIEFQTDDTVVMPVSGVSAFYDPALSAYSIGASVTAKATGSASRVNAGTLVIATGMPAGFSVTNKFAIETGYDAETDAELVDRIQTTLKGMSLQTSAGVRSTVMNNLDVREVLVADAQSPYQLRNNGKGGVMDVYVIDVLPVQATADLTYGSTTYFDLQPVLDITSVTSIEGGSPVSYVEGTHYVLVKDTNPLTSNSFRSRDRIAWILPGGTAGVDHPTGAYTVTYVHNQMLHLVNDLLVSDEYRPLMGDVSNSVLARSGTRRDVEIGFKVVTFGNFRSSRSAILTSATAAVQAFISAKGFNESIAISDVIAVIEGIPGVNYVNTVPTAFNFVGASIPTDGVLTTGAYEYMRASSITLE